MACQRRKKTLSFLLPLGCLLLSTQGCLATRNWVTEQLNPLIGRVAKVETRLAQTEAKVESTQNRLDHLRLEKQFVLNLKEGATFAPNSAALTPEAREQIDGFLNDLQEPQSVLFLVTGHSDRTGSADHNYALGQQRAASVAQYLIVQKGIDPLRVNTVSYGANVPVADNATPEGRRKNRRVEILVYREVITAGEAPPRPGAQGPEGTQLLPAWQ
jgi:outer membrane protein OmpA-like peptidoglycan-associated protein